MADKRRPYKAVVVRYTPEEHRALTIIRRDVPQHDWIKARSLTRALLTRKPARKRSR